MPVYLGYFMGYTTSKKHRFTGLIEGELNTHKDHGQNAPKKRGFLLLKTKSVSYSTSAFEIPFWISPISITVFLPMLVAYLPNFSWIFFTSLD